MKRIALAAATALMLAGPLATTASAQNYDRFNRGDQSDQRGENRDRNDDRGGRRNDNDRGRDDNRGDRANDHRGRGNNDWNRGDRHNDRNDGRWNDARNNGYSYNGRWYYGPPPASYGYVDYGYRNWRRGERLPAYYRDSYRPVDYRAYRLRQPPRGYHYVRDDRGDYLLVGIATGVILGIIASQ